MTAPVTEPEGPIGTAPASPARLTITRLRKTFAGVAALEDFELTLGQGEIHALLGENGSGKSTLIKILSGYHRPDSGTVHVAGEPLEFGSSASARSLGLRFVHQDLGLIDSMSVVDNLSIGVGFTTRFGTVHRQVMRDRAAELLGALKLHLNPDTSVGELTAAEKSGLAIARALGDGPQGSAVLILDEPTAALPVSEVDLLMGMVERAAASGVAVLYVSHRLDEIFRIARRVTVLRDGVVVGTDSVAAMDRQRLTSLMIGAALEPIKRMQRHSPGGESPAPVMRVQNLCTGSVSSLSFETFSGEVLGIAGITGSGRESVLGAIFGRLDRREGTVSVGTTGVRRLRPSEAIDAGMAYLAPDRRRDGGLPEFSARENISISDLRPFRSRLWLSSRSERSETARWFDRLDVRPRDDFERPFLKFSGGNQQKILFAKWLRRKPPVFLLEEPTQGVDVGARAQLHELLLEAAAGGMSVVISSSDIEELATVCHRILVMRDGRLGAELTGEDISVRRISTESQSAAGS